MDKEEIKKRRLDTPGTIPIYKKEETTKFNWTEAIIIILLGINIILEIAR